MSLSQLSPPERRLSNVYFSFVAPTSEERNQQITTQQAITNNVNAKAQESDKRIAEKSPYELQTAFDRRFSIKRKFSSIKYINLKKKI